MDLPAPASPSTILVLGGGPPSSLLTLPSYVHPRVLAAAGLYHSSPPGSKIICLSAGTAHVPQLSCPTPSGGRPIYESASCAAVLAGLGVPTEDVFCEITSYDTIGNIYFALTSFLLRAPALFPPSVVAVTSSFHLPRSKLVAEWVLSLSDLPRYSVSMLDVPDVGLSESALAERRGKEQKSIEYLNTVIPSITTSDQLFDWLTTTHTLYSSAGLIQRSKCDEAFEPFVSGEGLSSYGGGLRVKGVGGWGGGGEAAPALLLLLMGYVLGKIAERLAAGWRTGASKRES
ncbi:hypothetical protein TeGR_g9928 [Tetraparma gracilis]|uniref:DUF218 domain-containing protein n=1 Tax=Tetraparma gracilis TaxID=2962635 RepID=A0ABQ6MMB6_9STRA|nr:hypothetical protein TeGR_g9928 [Tetraparma gracilis]